ncbi:MAG: DUF3054 domain-containing protein [Thermoleophilia bacterium]|nr:DUF3054 domain-containing protein [Thermoleophilia bacterium]
MGGPAVTRGTAVRAAVLDLVAVVAFAALGRRSHGEALAGTLVVAAPFAIGAAVGWVVARAWRDPLAPSVGAVVWLGAAVAGLALRGAVFGRGLAPSFMVVSILTLGALIMGWRAVAALLRRRAPAVPAP